MNTEIKKIGHYDVLRKLSAGEQGEVYLARVEKPEFRFSKLVAIKILHKISDITFENEIKVLTSIQHPHLCSILDVGVQDDLQYIVFEYIEGMDLKKFCLKLKEKNLSLNTAAIVDIGEQVYSALKYLHSSQNHPILHKDISPQNIMVSSDGTVKIIDFGISVFKSEQFVQGKKLEGKPRYLPQEIIRGTEEYSEKSDMYSLGVVLYEISTTHTLHPGESLSLDNVDDPKLKSLIQKLTTRSNELSKEDFKFNDSNLQNVTRNTFDEKIISEHTIANDNEFLSNRTKTRSKVFNLKILGAFLVAVLIVGVIFAWNRNGVLYPLQGDYVMIRPSKDAGMASFNENISTSLQILNNEIIKIETELHGCRIIQRWKTSDYNNQILVIKEAVFELYEEYSKEKDGCIDNEKSKAMFFLGNDLAIRVELKIVDKMLHYRVLGLEGPFEEIYSRVPCRFYELNCWM